MQRVGPWIAVTLFFSCVACSGCGRWESNDSTPTADAARQTPGPDTRGPKEVLADFFKHVRQGRLKAGQSLLSKRASAVVDKLAIGLDPFRGDRSVRTDVGDVKLAGKEAHVSTTWTMGDGSAATSIEVGWVLRQDPEGWRIIGTKAMGPGGRPVNLDFENEQQMELTQQRPAPPTKSPSPNNDKPAVETAAKPARHVEKP